MNGRPLRNAREATITHTQHQSQGPGACGATQIIRGLAGPGSLSEETTSARLPRAPTTGANKTAVQSQQFLLVTTTSCHQPKHQNTKTPKLAIEIASSLPPIILATNRGQKHRHGEIHRLRP